MIYNLLDFLKTFGTTSTTNFDLYTIAYFLEDPFYEEFEVIMKNELCSLNEKNKNKFIINYQNINQKGTHWVAYTNGFYFDSFGLPPLEKIQPLVKEYNKIQVQHYETKICGVLCIYFLYRMGLYQIVKQSKAFDEIIKEMLDLYNELDVIKSNINN